MPPIAHRLTHAAHAKQHGKKQQQQLQQQANKRKSHSLTPPRAYIIIYSIQFDSIRYTQVLCTPRTKTSIFSFSPYEFICPSALNVTNIINTTFSTPRLVPFSCFSLVFLPSNFNENSSSLVIFFRTFISVAMQTYTQFMRNRKFSLDTVLLCSKVKMKRNGIKPKKMEIDTKPA